MTGNRFRLKEHLLEAIPGGAIDGDVVRMPGGVTIRPELGEIRDNGMAILYFHMACPDWDREVFETQVGIGGTPDESVADALLWFSKAMLDGLRCLGCEKYPAPIRERTEFAGKPHEWSVWLGSIISRGRVQSADGMDTQHYWNRLREEILKRAGNQKLIYVKVFGSRQGDDITPEVRVNDRVVPALSEIMRSCIETWDTETFCMHKQIFFLTQDSATYTPWPYDRNEMRAHLRTAALLFHEKMQAKGDFPFDAYEDELARDIGDRNLACEIRGYVPELLAERVFQQISIQEEITICAEDTEYACYRSQLMAMERIEAALDSEFIEWLPKEIFQEYVWFSSIGNVLNQVAEKHGKLEGNMTITLSMGFPEGYVPR